MPARRDSLSAKKKDAEAKGEKRKRWRADSDDEYAGERGTSLG